MKVRVLSKNHFDDILPRMRISNTNVIEHVSEAFISILNSDQPDSSYFDKDYPNVLRLVFDDVTDEEFKRVSEQTQRELTLFSAEQAKQVLSFLENNKHVDTLYVHCTAGVSRSGAVGTIANDFYGKETFFEFTQSNPYIKPNYFIVALLRRVYNNIDENE